MSPDRAASAGRLRIVLMRGGTSKCFFVREGDLPAPGPGRDRLLLPLMGSPDPMQLDGPGGTHSSTSKVVAVSVSERPDTDIEYLFAQVDVLAFVSQPDPVFAEHGFIRPSAARTGKSHEPDPALPVNLSFRLRHLFGPGGRSEVMRVLLTYPDGPLDAARIADEAGFAKRNISDVLTSLTNSGVIKAAWAGNERHFTAYRERWALLLDLAGPADTPSFVSWVHLLPAALEVVIWLDEKSDTAESEYLIASQARRLMTRLTRDLEAADVDLPRRTPAHGIDYLPYSSKPAAPSSPGWELLPSVHG